MMRKHILFLVSGLCLALSFTGCLEDQCDETLTYTYYEPIYMSEEDIQVDIVAEAPQDLEHPGKLYFYNQYVFVNELEKGVHVINNQDPTRPVKEAFIPIPGNVDILVRGNVLYADNYMDLLAIDITHPSAPQLLKRLESVFSAYRNDENQGVLIGYGITERSEERSCEENAAYWFANDGIFMGGDMQESFVSVNNIANLDGGNTNAPAGIAGSMARFGFADSYLYAIDDYELDVFNISDLACPEYVNTVEIGWGVETIFPYRNHLFIGARDGMHIFNNENPTAPYRQSLFSHATACDPVYVSGSRAFVTLRDGTECENFTNQLDIVDVNDLDNPFLIRTHPMQNPHGLSVTPGQKMFLCEGVHGVKVLDVTDSEEVVVLGEITHLDAYDAIALGEHHVMVIGEDGLYQFDTSNPTDIRQLSHIEVND